MQTTPWQTRRDDAGDDAPRWDGVRVDRGQLGKPVRRPDGTLLVEAFAVRPGIYEYRDGAGNVTRELVPLQTITDSAVGLARAPVTLRHPGEDVTPDNVQKYGVGDTDGETVIADNGYQRVKLAIRRRDAVDEVESGRMVEVSPGYKVRLDRTPGTDPVFGEYDAVQSAREYNHLAIVDRARGGPDIRLRADCAVQVTERRNDAASTRTDGAPMRFATLLALLGVTARVDSDEGALDLACNAVRKLKSDAEEAEKAAEEAKDEKASLKDEFEELKKENEQLKASNDKLKADMEKLEKDNKDAADAAARKDLLALAGKLQVDGADKLELPALRLAVAKAHMGNALRADAGDAYIDAVLDMARTAVGDGSGRDDGKRAWGNHGGTRTQKRDDAKDDPPKSRADAWHEQQQAAFQAGRGGDR